MEEEIVIRREDIPIFIGPDRDGNMNWDRRMGAMIKNQSRKYNGYFINEQSEEWQKRFSIALEKYFDDLRREKMSAKRYKIYKENMVR
jgi:hypothetical protein